MRETSGAGPRRVLILRERSAGEERVIVVPRDLQHFSRLGLEVLVESGAGVGVGYDDRAYEAAGAQVVTEVPIGGAVHLKYKAPSIEEVQQFAPGATLAAIFHAEGDMALVRALCTARVSAYTLEFFQEDDGSFPLAVPGGEIAGRMAVLYGAYYLQRQLGGAGVLIADVPGATVPKVVVVGHGNVGGAAARTAAALGAEVVVLGRREHALRRFAATARVETRVATPENLEDALTGCHLVIGAVLKSTWDTPVLISAEMIKRMAPGGVIVDATAGYGSGYIETFTQETTLADPTFERHGILHIKIDVLPRGVPVTAAHALSHVAAPYLARMALSIVDPSFDDPPSRRALIIDDGRVVHPVVKRHVELAGLVDALEF